MRCSQHALADERWAGRGGVVYMLWLRVHAVHCTAHGAQPRTLCLAGYSGSWHALSMRCGQHALADQGQAGRNGVVHKPLL